MRKADVCIASLFILSTLWVITASLHAQTGWPQLVPRSKEQRDQQMRMTLAAVVADESGAPIAGLTSKDFQLTENGKVQKILDVREFDDPVAAQLHGLIVLDAINSSTSAIHRQRNELKKFLGGENVLPYPIAIVIAANGGVIEGDASRDASSLMRDLDTRTKYLQGSDCSSAAPGADLESRMTETVATDAQGTSGSRSDCRREHFVHSMNALHQLLAGQADVPGRAILIWLGPGWPLPKERDSGQIMGKAGPAPSADMVVELYNDIRNGLVTFDAVSPESYQTPKGPRSTDAAINIRAASLAEQENLLTIPALSAATGGTLFAKSKNIAQAIAGCLQKEVSYYTLAFDPEPAKSSEEYRTVSVTVDKPGAAVRTVRSFFELQ